MAPSPCLVLAPEHGQLTIVAVNDAYVHAARTKRRDLIGRGLAEVFSDPADPSAAVLRHLEASLERVMQHRAPDAMRVQKYVRRPGEASGDLEVRWWSPVNSPVLGPEREVIYIVHRVDDVTELVRLEKIGAGREKLVEELQEAHRQLRCAQEEIAWLRGIARDRAEVEQRIESEHRFLAECGPVLASTLDVEETLINIARLAVRDLADFCLVDVVDTDGEPRRLKVASRDPADAWRCDLLAQIPLDRTRPFLVGAVLEAQHPVLLERLTPEDVASFPQAVEQLRMLHAADPRSIIAAPLVAHGKPLGVMVLVSSASSRIYGARDVRLAEELAHRAALSIENAQLYRAAQRATRMRDAMMGNVAHDLRSPLQSIGLQAMLLRRRGGPSMEEPAALIERSATHMERLIGDLLDVTLMEAGQLSLEQVRVSARKVVEESIEVQRPLAALSALELCVDVSPELPDVSADRDRLLQVFENLIGNALKFTRRGGRITIGAAPEEREVRFWVTDTGAGIAPEDVPHLFDRFWQARRSKRRGIGLGLAIVKGLVEAHGGRICVASTPGQGSTFSFTIPALPWIERASATPPRKPCP
ncbi:MAG TPA: ATP-binding protein [Kofleriaceae bacterium]|nr:ATP-binding protein [Kofleriaceae bacterium]